MLVESNALTWRFIRTGCVYFLPAVFCNDCLCFLLKVCPFSSYIPALIIILVIVYQQQYCR